MKLIKTTEAARLMGVTRQAIYYLIKTENDILINLDSQRIKQVLINVVKNAIEASKTRKDRKNYS